MLVHIDSRPIVFFSFSSLLHLTPLLYTHSLGMSIIFCIFFKFV
nr:MAG TPA: hypothetical protein [Caudoviricetes sp.]